jgi:hypothetical protein
VIDFLQNLGIFLALILIIVAIMFYVVWVKTGKDMERFKAHFSSTGDGSLKSMLLAIGVVVGLAVAAYLFNMLLSSTAQAEPVWFEETTLYAGIDVTREWSPQCYPDEKVDDRLTSNIGVRQSIVRIKDISVLGNYTHHSCAVGRDAYGYDGLGIQLEWRFKRAR